MEVMRVLVACEESQAVCVAFRKRGHEAYSCDIQPCSGEHPEWHIQGDARELLKYKWDLIIAHPPCTYLAKSGATSLFNNEHTIKDKEREKKGWEAKEFFLTFLNADCPHIAVENPIPLKHFSLPPYSQIIEPFMFGDPWTKKTCLWLRGLSPLRPTKPVVPIGSWTKVKWTAKDRSKTFPGIAQAMAEQWG